MWRNGARSREMSLGSGAWGRDPRPGNGPGRTRYDFYYRDQWGLPEEALWRCYEFFTCDTLEKSSTRGDHAMRQQEAPLSESDPIRFRLRELGGARSQAQLASFPAASPRISPSVVVFARAELDAILAVYARKVAAGEWRDYALRMDCEKAVFAIFQCASEYPLFRLEKCPQLARRYGAYSLVLRSGAVLRRGHDLARVLAACESVKLSH